jgi:hypothetical protein
MVETAWYPYDNGATLGQRGSEEGITLSDEEHTLGARITLERGGSIAPFAITCGIYGWMMHTRYFSLENEACTQYDLMRNAISELLDKASEGSDGGSEVPMGGVSAFVEMYP